MTDITSEYQEVPPEITFEEAVGRFPHLKAKETEAAENLNTIKADLFINLSVLGAFGTPEFVDLWKAESDRVFQANERLIAAEAEHQAARLALEGLKNQFKK
jgi:hypothetical protein